MRALLTCLALSLLAGPVAAQSPTPGMSLAQFAAMRFPQPIRAGDLLGRDVLAPVESQTVLGTVRDVVRDAAGTVQVVMTAGGFLGIGRRLIAVPLDAIVLLGRDLEVVAFKPAELRRFPPFSPAGVTPVPVDTILKVGLAKPSH